MNQEYSQKVKDNFEQKAAEYDSFMLKCVPFYDEMLHKVVDFIPDFEEAQIDICDLGSGTGNLTQLLSDRFISSQITCVDISPMMVDMAKSKLKKENVEFEIIDFKNFDFKKEYHIITSSLALHHLENDEDKKQFYKKIYKSLKPGGIFINGDVIIGNSEHIEQNLMDQWKVWLSQYHSEDDLMEMVINRYYEEDRPSTLANHLSWMDEAGFKNIDIVWKRMKGAVYCGTK